MDKTLHHWPLSLKSWLFISFVHRKGPLMLPTNRSHCMKLPPTFLTDSINLHLDLHFLSHLSIKMVLISFCFRIAEYPKFFKINSSPSTCPLNYIHSRLGWDLVTRSQPLRFDVTQQTSCSCWLWRWRDLGFCTVSLSGSQAIGSEMFSFSQTQFCQLYSENITAGTSQERGEE